MNDEVQGFINEMESDKQQLQQQNNELRGALANFQQDNNLVEYQLDTRELIEKIEHYLKGEIISIDEEFRIIAEGHVVFN